MDLTAFFSQFFMYEAVGAPMGGEVNPPHRTDHKNYFYVLASSMNVLSV